MRCEVVEFTASGMPMRLRWIQEGIGAGREKGVSAINLPLKVYPNERANSPVEVNDQEAAIAQWRKFLERTYRGKTPYQYHYCLKKFLVWCGLQDPPPTAVSRELVELYMQDLGKRNKPNGVKTHYKALRSFFAWSVEQGAPANPMEKIRSPKSMEGIHQRDALTDEEVIALLGTCKDTPKGRRDRAMISLMAYCGLRQAEVLSSDLADIETRDGRAILWVLGKGRSGKEEYVVLSAPAETALRDWMAIRPGPAAGAIFTSLQGERAGIRIVKRGWQQKRIALNTVREMVKKRMRLVGINSPRKTTHSLRHSAITNAIRNGASPLEAMAMARHLDLKTTMTYYHEGDRLKRPAEDRIVYSKPGAEEIIPDDQRKQAAG
jgi:integrase